MRAAKILILDDEPNTQKTLRRALELEGYAPVVAGTVQEAERMIDKEAPDLCLFDVRLPDGDGILLLEKLRKEGLNTPVVMMSGHGSIDEAVKATRLGARDFLEKPIGQDRLLLTIANALRVRRLEEENAELRREALETRGLDDLLGRSPSMMTLKHQIERVADSEGRVLITGENGTGKELIARALHLASKRRNRPFVSLNCAAVPAELIESELFGHEKGSFTGAVKQKLGKFERADGGTLFLDEVGDMPAAMQAKLLRVLQTGEVERVGGQEPTRVDVRVLAATNKELEHEIAEGRFREDLYYRLNVVPMRSPALRERKSDIPVLIEAFVAEAAQRNHRRPLRFADSALAAFASYDYPGNVRELRNLVERVVILAPPEAEVLEAKDVELFLPGSKKGPSSGVSYEAGKRLSELVEDAERSIVAAAMEAHGGVVADTARALGIERSNFHKKLKALGLK